MAKYSEFAVIRTTGKFDVPELYQIVGGYMDNQTREGFEYLIEQLIDEEYIEAIITRGGINED